MFVSVKSTDANPVTQDKIGSGKEQKLKSPSGDISIRTSFGPKGDDEDCLWITASKSYFAGKDDQDCMIKEAMIILTVSELRKLLAEAVDARLLDINQIPQVVEAVALLRQAEQKLTG